VGLLDGGAAALFGEILNPTFLPATISGGTTTATYDAGGRMQRARSDARTCQVQVDSATERMRQADGFTETDRAIYVLADSLEGDVDTDAEITVTAGPYAGATFRVATVDRDPAGAYWLCRGARKSG
jgi:hypothetical protein